jgi:hypothetical protein
VIYYYKASDPSRNVMMMIIDKLDETRAERSPLPLPLEPPL